MQIRIKAPFIIETVSKHPQCSNVSVEILQKLKKQLEIKMLVRSVWAIVLYYIKHQQINHVINRWMDRH